MKPNRSPMRSAAIRAVVPAFAVSMLARVMQVTMAVLAARILQPENYGVYTFALGVALLGGRLAGLGWPTLMNRMVPRYKVSENWPALRGLVRAADAVTIGGGLVAGAALVIAALALGPQSHLYLGLLMGGILLPVMAFRSLYRNLLAALRVPQRGIMVDELLPTLLMTVFLLPFIGGALSPQLASWLYIGASLVAVLAGAFWIRNRLPEQTRGVRPVYAVGEWMRTALPALVGMSAKLLMNRADIIMLAPLATMLDVGFYGAAMRVTYVQAAPVIVLSTVITARLSEAFAAGRVVQGRRLFFGALGFAAAWSIPFAIGLILFDDQVMSLLFGADYAPGAATLSILALAQVGAALNSPATSLMLMTGRQAVFGKMTVTALMVNIAGNFILIPGYGAEGAAIATAVSIIGLSVMQLTACALILKSGRYEESPK